MALYYQSLPSDSRKNRTFLLFFIFSDFAGVLYGVENLTLYADGCLVGDTDEVWQSSTWFSFPSKTDVIAVSVLNEPGLFFGFLGVFSNGVVTDSNWKCKESHSPENGWERANFTDDGWPHAYEWGNNSVTRAYGIPLNALWIHPQNHIATRFFCRRRFSKEESNKNSSKLH